MVENKRKIMKMKCVNGNCVPIRGKRMFIVSCVSRVSERCANRVCIICKHSTKKFSFYDLDNEPFTSYV